MSEAPKDVSISIIVVPHSGAPIPLSFGSLEALKDELPRILANHKEGYCYVHYNGKLCQVSKPIQVFKLKLPDGTEVMLGDQQAATFAEDHAFCALAPVSRQG